MIAQARHRAAAGLRVPLVAQATAGEDEREIRIPYFAIVVVHRRCEFGLTICGFELKIRVQAVGARVLGVGHWPLEGVTIAQAFITQAGDVAVAPL